MKEFWIKENKLQMCNTGSHPVDSHVLEDKHMLGVAVRTISSQCRLSVELIMEGEPRKSWDSRRQHLRRLPIWNPCLQGRGGGNQSHRCLESHCDMRVAFSGFHRRPTASLATRRSSQAQGYRTAKNETCVGGRTNWWDIWPWAEETFWGQVSGRELVLERRLTF